MTEPLLKPEQAAAYLGVSLGTLYNLSYKRQVPVVRIGRRIRFRRESLDSFAKRKESRVIE